MVTGSQGNGRGIAAAGRAFGALAVALPMVFGLSACSDRMLDTGPLGAITGEPSPVSDNSSPVRGMSGTNDEYPNLGTVPQRPTDLTTEAQRQQAMDRLAQDRAASRRTREQTEAIQVPEPLPIPPKPDLRPGKS
ncbi:hypothetical protein J2848_005353 [Azospirillum lipoferum]|uniref:DUF3035 domain-containing protein n=1 Tax=Azospirillum lipoferum TaxID=193 RepID=A0A5A9GHN0_AZOLI|nr:MULTISPECIES: hypothetical protein [Azospirillum]KAA0593242.1 hypothetical protein FZ942_25255 [Azospirillum lipoferum]MCP1613657.1 hypothetical protein [Azospirillum lipoferum]MDW5532418.1 hypothetical protein [Azospirillum sp. NL1]